MSTRMVEGVLAIVLGVVGTYPGDQPLVADDTLTKAQAEQWVVRVRKLVPDGWTVSTRDNDIVIQRDKLVRFARMPINAPAAVAGADQQTSDLQEGPYRLTLRFTRKMSLDEYESLKAANLVSQKARERLEEQARLHKKFSEFIATTPEEEARLKTYQEAVAKLVWHDLPDLYTPDHSIHLFQSWSFWTYVYDKDVARECREVRESMMRYFGTYDPGVATGKDDPAKPEPQRQLRR